MRAPLRTGHATERSYKSRFPQPMRMEYALAADRFASLLSIAHQLSFFLSRRSLIVYDEVRRKLIGSPQLRDFLVRSFLA